MLILNELGISPQYQGYAMTAAALSLMDHVPGMLDSTMQIYACVGQTLDAPPQNVERNIRTVARHAWRANRSRLEAMAGYALPKPPSAGEFLSILHLHRRAG